MSLFLELRKRTRQQRLASSQRDTSPVRLVTPASLFRRGVMSRLPFAGVLPLILLVSALTLGAVEPLATWTMHTSPYGKTNSWRGITFANGKFVACGSKGLVATSTNGSDWSPHSANTTKQFYSVAFGGGLFVGTGQSGLVATSADGETWQLQDSNSNAHLYDVSYNNGLFVTVSDSGVILISPNGVTWTPCATANTNKWRASAYGNGTHLVVGYRTESPYSYTRSAASPTLSNWDVRDTGQFFYLSGLTFGAGKFVACGYGGTVQTSMDGVNWSSPTSAGNAWLNCAAYADHTFMAVGESGSIQSSTNGVNWDLRHSSAGQILNGVAYGHGTWVAVGDSSLILQSDPTSGSPSNVILLTDALRTGTQFSFKFNGTIGKTYLVQVSTNLISWITLANVVCTNSPMNCSLTGQTTPNRFYRILNP